jgi:hypothetical protein
MNIIISTVYNLGMPKCIYVQIKGAEKPARVEAETFEKVEGIGGVLTSLILKTGTTIVAEFKGPEIQGWWIQNE